MRSIVDRDWTHRNLTLKNRTLKADWSIKITKSSHQNRFQPIEIEISRFVIYNLIFGFIIKKRINNHRLPPHPSFLLRFAAVDNES